MMAREKRHLVMLRTKYDRKRVRDISQEPEMIELRRMIRAGELDPVRVIKMQGIKESKGK